MKRAVLLKPFGGLRARVALLLMAAVLVTGIGYEAVLVSMTRTWLFQELDERTRAIATGLAARCVTPLVVGDVREIRRELHRLTEEADLAGAAVYRADGTLVASQVIDPSLATRVSGPLEADARTAHAGPRLPRAPGAGPRDVVIPIVRHAATPGSPEGEASELFGLEADPAPAGGRSRPAAGWVRIVMSSERQEQAVATATQLGILLLIVILACGLIAASRLGRLVVRPLREASELAGEIATGQLERRIPVRGEDELGALAQSMNVMAAALQDAQGRAEAEADALRAVADAVLAIAAGARITTDPDSVFGMVAEHVRRMTACHGVALLTGEATGSSLSVVALDPPGSWGGLTLGDTIDPAAPAARLEGEAVHSFAPESGRNELESRLAGDSMRSAQLVALALEDGPPAYLVLASRDPDCFRTSEADLVAGLASHLSSALRAEHLRSSLQRAFGELEKTREYLSRSESLRMAGEIASGVAHEFNNLLAAILGRAQLVRHHSTTGKLTPEDLIKALDVIERASRDGSETVRRLRQFSRGDREGGTEIVNLDAIVRDAVEFTKPRWVREAQAAGRSIRVEIDSSPNARIAGRAHELREVVTNLLLNAIDALPKGGEIRITTRVQDESVQMVVEDDGVGMEDETRRRLFDPFFTTKGTQGSGLGMTVVYGIVRGHGGRIEIASTLGRGTRIELALPRAAARPRPAIEIPADRAAETRTPPEPPAPPQVEGLRVLIVDDEKAVRDVLKDIFETLGWRVVACESADSALAAFEPGRFELVVTDLGMPGKNGWQFARELRERDSQTSLAFVTGWGEHVSAEEVERAGANAVVAKPFSIDAIDRMARRLVPPGPAAAAA